MIRAALGLLLAAGFCLMLDTQEVLAQKGGNSGTISKVNAKSGSITINMMVRVKKKNEVVDKEFFLNDDAKVTISESGEKKTLTGKEALAMDALKEGAAVTFTTEAGDLKIKELNVGGPSKKKPQQ